MPQEPKFPGIAGAWLLLLAVVLGQIGLGVLLAVAGLLFKGPGIEHPASIGVVSLLAFGVPLGFFVWWTKAPLAEAFPLKPVQWSLVAPVVLGVLGLGILLSELDNLVRYLQPPPRWLAEAFRDLTQARKSFWGSFFALVIAAPLTEELCFRGFILRGFLSRYSVRKSVLVSAILFGVIHLNPWQFFSATVLGLMFGWWFVRSRSLFSCLAGHAVANGVVLAHSFLPFKIPGFNTGELFSAQVEFQPLWFDLVGAVLLGIGLWLFARWVEVPSDLTPGVGRSPPGAAPGTADLPPPVGSPAGPADG